MSTIGTWLHGKWSIDIEALHPFIYHLLGEFGCAPAYALSPKQIKIQRAVSQMWKIGKPACERDLLLLPAGEFKRLVDRRFMPKHFAVATTLAFIYPPELWSKFFIRRCDPSMWCSLMFRANDPERYIKPFIKHFHGRSDFYPDVSNYYESRGLTADMQLNQYCRYIVPLDHARWRTHVKFIHRRLQNSMHPEYTDCAVQYLAALSERKAIRYYSRLRGEYSRPIFAWQLFMRLYNRWTPRALAHMLFSYYRGIPEDTMWSILFDANSIVDPASLDPVLAEIVGGTHHENLRILEALNEVRPIFAKMIQRRKKDITWHH